MLFTPNEIQTLINRADETLYSMPKRIAESVVLSGSTFLDKEMQIIYDIKKAVEWGKEKLFSDESFHGLVAYFQFKIEGYGYNGKIPYYAAAISTANESVAPAVSGYQFFIQMVGGDSNIEVDATVYTNSNLIGRYVVVSMDGVILPVGLANTISYTYDIETGTITFNTGVPEDMVIQIFTYIPNLIGWQLFDKFEVGGSAPMGAGDTVYSNVSLIGKSVAVVVDGKLLPFNLPGSFGYSFSSLTGTITFTQGLSADSAVSIFIF